MPIVREVQGDLLKNFSEGKYWGIAHGCNTQLVMGAGIAKSIVDIYPDVLEADKRHEENFIEEMKLQDISFVRHMKMGHVSVCFTEHGIIFNAYTQVYPGQAEPYTVDGSFNRVTAVINAFTLINKSYQESKLFLNPDGLPMGIPLIGAGLAGGNWDEISNAINHCTDNMEIELVRYVKN